MENKANEVIDKSAGKCLAGSIPLMAPIAAPEESERETVWPISVNPRPFHRLRLRLPLPGLLFLRSDKKKDQTR